MSGIIHRRYGSPTAEKSKLGWILCGKVQKAIEGSSCFMISISEDERVDKQLEQFWQVGEIDTEQRIESAENQLCEELYTQNVTRSSDRRYQVKLPFKGGQPILGQSRKIAIAQLNR